MEITSLIQSNFTTLSSIEAIKNNSTVTQNNTNNISNSINKNAYNYVDLGVDISGFIEVDTVQNQTNKELAGYLTSIMDNESIEGKKNLYAYDLASVQMYFADSKVMFENLEFIELPNLFEGNKLLSSLLNMGISLEEVKTIVEINDESLHSLANRLLESGASFEKIKTIYELDIGNKKSYVNKEMSHQDKEMSHQDKDSYVTEIAPNLFLYNFDTFKSITHEEAGALRLEKFKNLYSFSEEFAQTQGFEDLYQKYMKQSAVRIEIESGRRAGSNDYHGVEAKITSNVVSKNLSKSEVIEYYTSISNDLKDKLVENSSTRTIAPLGKSEIRGTINLYDKITSDLKDMWGFGDLDIRG